VSRKACVYFIFSAGFSFKRLRSIFMHPSSSSESDSDTMSSSFFYYSTIEIFDIVYGLSSYDSASSFSTLIAFFFSFCPTPSINFYLFTFTCFMTSSLTSILDSNWLKLPPSFKKISREVFNRLL
jgi:hypothetical protein